jgi:hypothetical protein
MKFDNRICWRFDEVRKVINPDAEAVPDEVFMAVHTDQPIRLSLEGVKEDFRSPDEFLKAFVDPNRSEVHAVVLGQAGAGKSHFIHWLDLNIPRTDDARVISIPKAGTSLRSILKMIIAQLPENEQQKYFDKLADTSGDVLTKKLKMARLLDSIAQAIEIKGESDKSTDGLKKDLLELLPDLFRDPQLREKWFLKDRTNNIIEQLVHHIFDEKQRYDPINNPQGFTIKDLTLEPGIKNQVSLKTLQIVDILLEFGDNPKELAVEIINSCLQTATHLALSFSSEHLIDLMTELRQYLLAKGMSLILLIEDLARLQGVDRALLQALTTPTRQHNMELCTLRWAAAVTTGYYNHLDATVLTRINILARVVPRQELLDSIEGQNTLAQFSSRYLNAARIGEDNLKVWHSDDSTDIPPKVCEECEHKEKCHTAFGHVDGYGLYPFTVKALWNMATRVAREEDDDHWFNPRRVLKKVLINVLANHCKTIENGLFPPPQLLEELGGPEMETMVESDLRRVSGNNFERYRTFLELWDGSGKIVSFNEDLLASFGLEKLTGMESRDDQTKPPTGGELDAPEPRTTPQTPSDPILKELDNWAKGAAFSDNLAAKIRPIVFDFLRANIDWDAVGIAETAYVSRRGSKPFRQSGIKFRDQLSDPKVPLPLWIPTINDEQNRSKAAIALQGLYQFKKHKNWSFERGGDYLIQTQECLEQWSDEVVRMLKNVPPRNERWDVIDAIAELLCVGAALSGKIRTTDPEKDLWNAMWGSMKEPGNAIRTSNLRNLTIDIAKQWDRMQYHLKAWHAGTKGGSAGNYLNPFKPQQVIKRLKRNNWSLTLSPGEEKAKIKDFNEIRTLYKKIAKELPGALSEEFEDYKTWSKEMTRVFGLEADKVTIKGAFEGIDLALDEYGLKVSGRKQLREIVESYSHVQFDNTKKRIDALLRGVEKGLISPFQIGQSELTNTMTVAEDLAEKGSEVLNNARMEYEVRKQESTSVEGKAIETCWSKIEDLFIKLEMILDQIIGSEESEDESY